jgi:hypothetical protein
MILEGVISNYEKVCKRYLRKVYRNEFQKQEKFPKSYLYSLNRICFSFHDREKLPISYYRGDFEL